MNPLIIATLILAMFFSSVVFAEGDLEKDRLSGFAEHQKKYKAFDKERTQGEKEHLEKEIRWSEQKEKERAEYKRNKVKKEMREDGPEARADAASKKEYVENYEKERVLYMKDRARKRSISREALKLPSEKQELGLDQVSPRYDYRKRVFYGASPKWGKKGPGSSDSFTPSFGGGSSFPPPPTFDDFGGDPGYVPPPNMGDEMGDFVPPPPMPGGNDFGPGSFGGEGATDFAPPPPPPPFVNEGNNF